MRSARWLVLLLPLFAPGVPAGGQTPPKPADPPAPAGFHRVTLGKHTFTLPKGFAIELVAESPQVERPVVASFDDKGRLFVADSSGDNSKPADQLKNPTHRVVMLESTKKDGKFDKSTVFADKLSFLQGCLAHGGSVYVATPPTIQKLTDTDNDGKADKRETWFDGGVLGGCANDVHGPYPGPDDGRLYWTKGGFEKQTLTLGNGRKVVTRAAHIYSAKEDGTDLRVEMTGGMDNPVDVVFNTDKEMFFTTTFLQHPANGKRDGIIHATYGAVYGKDHDPVQEHVRTRPELSEPMTHLGPAAPAGLHCYRSGAFGEDYTGNLFVCQFNMAKVSRHVLKENGSTYTTTDFDFVVSDNRDFHPTDVIEDADGSLLVIDTGGWYKLCCPSSVMEKKDVLGAIYRVRQEHQPVEWSARKSRDWKKFSTNDLVYGFLRDEAESRRHSDWAPFAELATRGKEAVEVMSALLDDPNADNEHTWHILLAVAAHINSPEARELARKVLEHFRPRTDGQKVPVLGEEGTDRVRLAAVRTLGLMQDKDAVPQLVKQLESKSVQARRTAAEALGKISDPKVIAELFTALADVKHDRVLDTAYTRALIDIGDADGTRKGLGDKSPKVVRATIAALEFIPDAKLTAKEVRPSLLNTDADLRETAWWIAGRHKEWGDELADVFAERLKAKFTPTEAEEWAGRLARFAGSESIQKLIAGAIADATTQPVALRAIRLSRLKAVPDRWVEPLVTAVKGDVSGTALRVVRSLPWPKPLPKPLTEAAVAVGDHEQNTAEVRLGAIALHAELPSGERYKFVRDHLSSDHPAALRGLAVEALAKADLSVKQLVNIAEAIPTASPLDIDKLLGLFAKSTDEAVGMALVKALSEPKVRAAVRTEQVKPILDKFPQGVQAEAEKLYKLLETDRAELTKKLDAILKETKPGDVRRGQAVFNSAKAACASCHKVAYVGGAIGPDLTKIGSIRSDRDLLESIVFPSASFVRSYEPVRVETKDGKSFNGILKADRPDEVVLTVNATEEVRIGRKEIDELKPGTVSVMPAGLDQQLTPQELADLVAFLRSLK